MFEAVILVVLVMVVVLAIRGKKSIVFENPVVIQRVGLYHATLAPQLEMVQDFIGQIASLWAEADEQSGDLATQYFEIFDAHIPVTGQYLLAVALRAGIVYFQAILPVAENRYSAIRNFSEQVMVHHPLPASQGGQGAIQAVVEAAAKQMQISCISIVTD